MRYDMTKQHRKHLGINFFKKQNTNLYGVNNGTYTRHCVPMAEGWKMQMAALREWGCG